MVRTLFVAFTVFCSLAAAQSGPTVSQHYKPTDPLHYYVKFDGDPSLEAVTLEFVRQDDGQKVQQGLVPVFDISQSKKISPGVFEVNGTIPSNVATGDYLLNLVQAAHSPVSQNYHYPTDFTNKNLISIISDVGYKFPPVKSVTSEPPK